MNVEEEPKLGVRPTLQKEAVARGVSIPENPTSIYPPQAASTSIANERALRLFIIFLSSSR
jgi:hypothetical protein